ncbi:hypothetical protein [Romboutsia timonensis]|uniref:hypothetical protein n=1 Tax=Romboutsia timonensis TaxID=1776391 RepID=UPI0023F72866|nr:hypothetical protein [Romboutsia timonensis]
MKITFRNGFEMTQRELNRKTIDELYDIHCDLVNSYNHYNDKGEIDRLETYIECRLEEERELAEII